MWGSIYYFWHSNSNSLQVMQFGRIDNNAYTLDFQYPFTAVQAFGLALANVAGGLVVVSVLVAQCQARRTLVPPEVG